MTASVKGEGRGNPTMMRLVAGGRFAARASSLELVALPVGRQPWQTFERHGIVWRNRRGLRRWFLSVSLGIAGGAAAHPAEDGNGLDGSAGGISMSGAEKLRGNIDPGGPDLSAASSVQCAG